MNEGFIETSVGPFRFHAFERWLNAGVEHGFIGATGDFSEKMLKTAAEEFKKAFYVRELVLPKQTHSNTVVTIDSLLTGNNNRSCGDSIFLAGTRQDNQRAAFGIRTADCLPIIIRGRGEYALIHAGWRGLENGIIENTLAQFTDKSNLEALIGPAAGPERYQIGLDVEAALGVKGVFLRDKEEKLFLDLQGTAEKILKAAADGIKIFRLPICTIADKNFHSFRRDKDNRGSNLAFLILPNNYSDS